MKHIRIFEDFSANTQLNEANETTLPGGFINVNTDDSNSEEGFSPKPDIVYFQTNTTTPSNNLGTPGTLTSSNQNGNKYSNELAFFDNNFRDTDRTIRWNHSDFSKLQAGQAQSADSKTILAKNPQEAKSKAYEILLHATFLTPVSGDPKAVGNLLRGFFEIRKMYPEYMTKNDLLKGFLSGIIEQFPKPNFGEFTGYDQFSKNIKDDVYVREVSAVLKEYGVIKPAPTPAPATKA